MASKRRRNASLHPWIWAIEALASNQTDTSLLTDLVKKIPGELSNNDGKNVRELVSLRILESLSVLEKGKNSDVLPKVDASVGFSPSDCCEDVLRQVLCKSSRENQKSNESGKSKGDMEPFVQHKRSCLPKCRLKQLKDAILKDSDLIPSSVKEKSGLLNKNHFDGIPTRPERSDCDALEIPPVRDLTSGKTVVSDSATANQEGSSACNQLIVYNAYPNFHAALKRKQDVLCTQKAVEGKDSASFNERKHVEDVPVGIVQHSVREEPDLPGEPRVENVRETVTSENVDYDCVASKKLKTSYTASDAELLQNQSQATHNAGKMNQGTSGKEHGLNIGADEANRDGEHCVEPRTLGNSPRVVNQETKSVDGAKENCEHSFSLTPNSVHCGEIKSTMEHDHQLEILCDDETYNDENDDIIIRKDAFLNSQYSHSQDSLATLNGTNKLCMVCKTGGQLLVCSSGSCQRVVHEKCMGVAPTFDVRRSFYCPFCAYSQAISEYSESKKKYSLARKALMAFLSRDEYRMRNSNISRGAGQNHLKKSEVSDKCIEQNSLENVVSRDNENQLKKNMRDKPSVSCDSSSRERAKAVTCGGNDVALEDKRNAERGSSSVCCQSPSELEQQLPVLGVQNGEADNSQHGGSEQLAAFEKFQEVSHHPNGVARVKNKEKQYIASGAVQDREVHNSKSNDLKIANGREQHAGTERKQDVSKQPLVLPCEPAKRPHSDVVEGSGEKEDKSVTCYPSLRVRKREQQYTYPSIPQLRRKKIPWSNAEEEALKEGVRRFTSNHDGQMPWKRILEYGADIFENRTTIDLKDKWRNICKGSPKV